LLILKNITVVNITVASLMKQYFIDHLNTLSIRQREQLMGYAIDMSVRETTNQEHIIKQQAIQNKTISKIQTCEIHAPAIKPNIKNF
jgi:hypothetical protein